MNDRVEQPGVRRVCQKRVEHKRGDCHRCKAGLRPGGDLESDWTVKNDKPHYGLKEHASVDVNSTLE